MFIVRSNGKNGGAVLMGNAKGFNLLNKTQLGLGILAQLFKRKQRGASTVKLCGGVGVDAVTDQGQDFRKYPWKQLELEHRVLSCQLKQKVGDSEHLGAYNKTRRLINVAAQFILFYLEPMRRRNG